MIEGTKYRRGFLRSIFAAVVALFAKPISLFPQVARQKPLRPLPIENERLVRDFFNQVFNLGNASVLNMHDVAAQKCADEFHRSLGKELPSFANVAANFRHAMPDLHFDILSINPEGGELFVRWRATGTHRGDLYGWKGTGRKVSIDGDSRVTVVGGKVTRMLQTYDAASLRQQLQQRPS
jgi:predicted ester cyclase